MEGLLFFVAVFFVLSGPIAMIVSFAAIKRLRELQSRVDELAHASRGPAATLRPVASQRPELAQKIEAEPVFEEGRHETGAPAPIGRAEEATRPVPPPASVAAFFPKDREARVTPGPVPQAASVSLEQRIGTRWVLIAGVITVMFAVGFFLKYAYEQRWIGPLGRVLIAGFSGLAALAVGELTRRRGYDIVAKGVTALGFAILYATVFAAHRWYHLIGPPTAFVLALGVTAGAMLYAVVLDEIVIAMLSLIGGYLTPIVLATGQNLPTPLFSYVLILSAGAVACAYWRKWSPVNVLAFVGTYLLYTGWFERFYRPAMTHEGPPEQLGVALFWLAVFFLVYLMLPLLHTLVRRVKSGLQDMVPVLANAAVVFYYLWTILNHDYRAALAWCSVGMGAAHLALAGVVIVRCREDSNLWQVLLMTGLSFITLAVPLYFEVYAVAMLWAVEALLLIVVGLRYGSLAAQLAGTIVLALAVVDLLTGLPMHVKSFPPVFNTAFSAWCFVAATMVVCHVLYRLDKHLEADVRSISAQAFYVAGLGLLMAAITMELWWHRALNVPAGKDEPFFWEQMVLVFAAFILLFITRPICPRGQAARVVGTLLVAAAVVDLLTGLPMHIKSFPPVFNTAFGAWCLVAATVMVCHVLYRLDKHLEADVRSISAQAFYVAGLGLLMAAITMELWWHGELNMPARKGNPFFWEQMAPVFALFILLFIARPICPRGQVSKVTGTLLAGAAAIYVLLTLPRIHEHSFTMFANGDFARAILLVAVLFASAWLLRRTEFREPDEFVASGAVAVGAILVLWILLTGEIWLYYDRLRPSAQWRFLAQMYISMMWAVYATVLMVVGFWRRVRPLRYVALGIFVLLLAKIFLVDTRELDTAYRIAGFLVTGLALVGVSYLYQYLKKTGFFDAMLAEKNTRS